ncbi:hypothetical protein HPB52_001243 [Rhipicephalus sanguineus]|uniref:Peptidase M13 N-terminal domain-containing protein n=1 Tax=Rhipicephalus sanguineus TaxID=34632 RepID=A0A9D4PUY2_RHISA|nr:hypothetical protein HPB52_001243 [Rhipicephalus sanguineus]
MTCITLTYTFYYAREYGKAERLKQVGIEYYDCQAQACKDAATLRKGPLEQRLRDETSAMRLFYSCHDMRSRQQEALRPLTLLMRSLSLSEWPYELGERLPRARFVLQRLSVDYALPFFVSLRVEPDPRDAHVNLLSVDLAQPLLHLVAADDALLVAHAAYIRRSMALMGAQDMAAAVATDVHDYEFALAEIPRPALRYRGNPMELYDEEQFHARYRFTKNAVRQLLAMLPLQESGDNNRGQPVPPMLQLLIANHLYSILVRFPRPAGFRKSAQQTTAAIFSPPASSQTHPESRQRSPQNPLLEPIGSSNREECCTQHDKFTFAPSQQESETNSRGSPPPQTPPSWKHTAPPSCYPADPPADSSPEETRLAGSPHPSFPAAADVTRSPQKKAASSLGTAKTAAATLVPTAATTDTMKSTGADEQVIPPDAAARQQATESAGKGKQLPSQHATG